MLAARVAWQLFMARLGAGNRHHRHAVNNAGIAVITPSRGISAITPSRHHFMPSSRHAGAIIFIHYAPFSTTKMSGSAAYAAAHQQHQPRRSAGSAIILPAPMLTARHHQYAISKRHYRALSWLFWWHENPVLFPFDENIRRYWWHWKWYWKIPIISQCFIIPVLRYYDIEGRILLWKVMTILRYYDDIIGIFGIFGNYSPVIQISIPIFPDGI